MKIEFYDINEKEHQLTYVVMCAMYKQKWVFVRHQDRDTWEVPGGHIEENELPDDAAARELREEAGAIKFELIPICDYSVEDSQGIGFGRLYFAQIEEYEARLEYEIVEIIFRDELPHDLTYKEIQPHLFKKVKESISLLERKKGINL